MDKPNTFKGVINYDRSIADLVKTGKYDGVNIHITEKNFPSSEKGEKEGKFGIFHFNKSISSEGAIVEMEKAGYHAATMKELLSFGEKNSDVQRKFTIVALGSVARLNGHQRVDNLDEGGSGRYADLGYFDYDWYSYCRFLAVRN